MWGHPCCWKPGEGMSEDGSQCAVEPGAFVTADARMAPLNESKQLPGARPGSWHLDLTRRQQKDPVNR